MTRRHRSLMRHLLTEALESVELLSDGEHAARAIECELYDLDKLVAEQHLPVPPPQEYWR